MISFCIMTKDRDRHTKKAIENIYSITKNNRETNFQIVLLINGGEKILGEQLEKFFYGLLKKDKKNLSFKLLYSKVNVGVAEGRNILYKNSKNEILCFIDDDAIILNKKDFVKNVVDDFSSNRFLGIISFKSLNPSGEYRNNEMPIKKKFFEEKTLTSKFVGVGHIIHKRAINLESLYPPKLFFGMEEYYLSYRVIEKGFEIVYDPKYSLIHYKSDKTRLKPVDYYIHQSSNKIFISFLSNKVLFKFTNLILWNFWLFIKCLNPIVNIKMMKRLNSLMKSQDYLDYKYIISKKMIKYIKRVKGNLWF